MKVKIRMTFNKTDRLGNGSVVKCWLGSMGLARFWCPDTGTWPGVDNPRHGSRDMKIPRICWAPRLANGWAPVTDPASANKVESGIVTQCVQACGATPDDLSLVFPHVGNNQFPQLFSNFHTSTLTHIHTINNFNNGKKWEEIEKDTKPQSSASPSVHTYMYTCIYMNFYTYINTHTHSNCSLLF